MYFLCSQLVNAQKNSNYVADFDSVFSVYSKHIEPYLKKFAENNYNSADPVLIDATYRKYKAKVNALRTEYLEVFERNKNNTVYSKSYFHGVLDQAFQFEFPCLDHLFFDAVGKEVADNANRDYR
jgi:hypothetical protein